MERHTKQMRLPLLAVDGKCEACLAFDENKGKGSCLQVNGSVIASPSRTTCDDFAFRYSTDR